MKRKSWRISCLSLCFVVASALFAGNANAQSVFVLDDLAPALSDGLSNGDTVTVDGIDLTFSNVVVADGSTTGDVEGVGILLSSTTEPGLTDVISFDFSFSEAVQISTYDIGTREDVPSASSFTVTGPNGTSGNNLIPQGTSFSEVQLNFDPGTIPFLAAGQVYSFTHNLPSSGEALFNLEELVVEVVPEPSACCLLAVGCLGLSTRRRRLK